MNKLGKVASHFIYNLLANQQKKILSSKTTTVILRKETFIDILFDE